MTDKPHFFGSSVTELAASSPHRPRPDIFRGAGKFYLVGGGIASLAAAAFLIRDGCVPGRDIVILEEQDTFGGSLDAAGSGESGYTLRGGRMLESKYLCTFDLFSSIETLGGGASVTQEIFDWNHAVRTLSRSRLFRDGKPQSAPAFGLHEAHILTLERLALEPEALLGRSRIEDHFDALFFTTDFWIMWCTTFAFQPWHSAIEFKRYLKRFAHMVSGFNRLEGIIRTVFNQYESLVLPLVKWLDDRGVVFQPGTTVTDLRFGRDEYANSVTHVLYQLQGMSGDIALGPHDHVFVTLGSMTDSSSFGSTEIPPVLLQRQVGSAWTLWEAIAAGRPEFGNPAAFDTQIDQSKWISFTSTMHDPALLRIIAKLTSNVPGEGGLITFPDSNWLASIVVPHQPHFIGQPEDVNLLWGYGLRVDVPGNFVTKPMSQCNGREIMTEILGHLHVNSEPASILERCICIPCMMPYITSQFLPRQHGDRPQIFPAGWRNIAFLGQFCEMPDDVVFTVEYSIRSAQTAVYTLLGRPNDVPEVYKGGYDPRVLYTAFRALHDLDA